MQNFPGRHRLTVLLESASRLQELVQDTVLVGGTAAILYGDHRDSQDHDHVLADLEGRFDIVLEALESEGDWVTNRVRPGKLILGRLGDIETGVRQLIRTRPLETTEVALESGRVVRVPTVEESLRVKAFLIVRRNQTRDYLDVAAVADRYGIPESAGVLAAIDDYYADQESGGDGVVTQLLRQLADPRPADQSVTRELHHYRNLDPKWANWATVKALCRDLASHMLGVPS